MTEIHPQFIHTASEELVVLTRAEFDALMARPQVVDEDGEDDALFAARMTDLKAGMDARLPAEVSALMMRGDSLLRALRKWKGLTQTDVMRKTNLAQSYISDLENGAKPGTFNALWMIAKALEIDEAWIIPQDMNREQAMDRS